MAQPSGAQVADPFIMKVRAEEGFLHLAAGLGCPSPEQRFHQPVAGCVGILLLLPVEESAFWALEHIYFPHLCATLTSGPFPRAALNLDCVELIGISVFENEQLTQFRSSQIAAPDLYLNVSNVDI